MKGRQGKGRQSAHAIAIALLALASRAATAHAQPCPRLPAGLVCAPVPTDETARHQLLQALDVEGRDAVSRGDYAIAAAAFGCLVEADPTPESAGNLTVVLREQKALGDALLMARCAEQLSAPGPARQRATSRRLDIEARLGLPPPAVAIDVPVGPRPTDQRREPPEPPARARRGWAYGALAVGATVLVGAGVVFLVAHQRAQQFADEQQANGYSDRARQLHDSAQNLQTGSWVATGLGAASVLAGGALLRFKF